MVDAGSGANFITETRDKRKSRRSRAAGEESVDQGDSGHGHRNTSAGGLGSAALKHVHGIRDRMRRIKRDRNLQAVQRRRAFFTSAAEELSIVEAWYGAKSKMYKLMTSLQSPRLQFVLTALLLVDVLIVVLELFLDAEFPGCNIIVRDAVSCCGQGNSSCGGGGYSGRMLAPGDSICEYPLVESPTLPAGCDPYKHSGVKSLMYALFGMTVFILSVYEVELFLLFVVLRRHFFKNKLYIIDSVVVTAALTLEVVVKLNKGNGDIAGVLTFARCWRFVRLGHGLVSSVHEAHSGHVEEMQLHVDGLMEHLTALQNRLEYLETQALQAAGGKALKKFGSKQRRNSLQARLAAKVTDVSNSIAKLTRPVEGAPNDINPQRV